MTDHPRTLADVLASTSDVLFPQHAGEWVVTIHSRGSDDDSPLHVMAWCKDSAGAAVLVAAGADVNAVGDMGETPLHAAVSQRDRTMIELLLKAGARSDIRSELDQTPLELAASLGDDVLSWLTNPDHGSAK